MEPQGDCCACNRPHFEPEVSRPMHIRREPSPGVGAITVIFKRWRLLRACCFRGQELPGRRYRDVINDENVISKGIHIAPWIAINRKRRSFGIGAEIERAAVRNLGRLHQLSVVVLSTRDPATHEEYGKNQSPSAFF